MNCSGIILCGGRGSRMGGVDKGLVSIDGKPLAERVALRFAPQVQQVLISANRNASEYRRLGYEVIADSMADFQGPLAGIAACLPHCDQELVAVVSCDTPALPLDLVSRLGQALADPEVDLSFAHDGQRSQYLCTLMRRSLLARLNRYLSEGGRAVRNWHSQLNVTAVDFSDQFDAFANLNRLQE
ncbi:MAG: molybdenum cofactor guanylyltransferase MobA [Halieaceae bacterium]